MTLAWKPNWEETKQHFVDWWKGEGLVLSIYGTPKADPPHEVVADPGPPPLVEAYTDGNLRARVNHFTLAGRTYPADCMPLASADIGPGSLALLLGSEPGFSPQTVWFEPCIGDVEEPEKLPKLQFDPENKWWRVHEATLRAEAEMGRGKYMASCPDLIENIDVLASLRGSERVLFDMIERPEWVKEKLIEINQVFFEAYSRIYDIIKLPDGGSSFGAFALWGPGKTAKVQCDASAMISPNMFAEFVVPPLIEQCKWLDYSMFHLDGTQCICHLDHLLEIEELDAIEWTPQAGIEQGGDPRWYPIYKRILAAGKSVQAVGVMADEVIPLLDEIGPKGVYIMAGCGDESEAERLIESVEAYRGANAVA